jgi:hypothetical protein
MVARAPMLLVSLLVGCTSQVGTLSIGVTRSADKDRDPLEGRASRVRVRIDGPGVQMLTEVPYGDHQVVLKDIPVGEARQVTVAGVDAAGNVVSKGSSCPFALRGGDNELSVFVALFGKQGAFSLAPGIMNQARAFHTATVLADGCSLLLAGGTRDHWQPESSQLPSNVLYSAERIDGGSAEVEPGRARCVQGGEPGCMWQKRIGHSSTLLPDGNVLVAGGSNGAAATNSCELYEPGAGAFQKSAETRYSQIWHQAALAERQVALLGGVDYLGGIVDTAQAWQDGSAGVAFPSLQTPRRAFTLTTLPDGTLFVAGGYDANGEVIATTEVLRPGYGSRWGLGPRLSLARAHHAATLLPDGTVLITAGVTAGGQATGTLERCDRNLSQCVTAGPLLKTTRWAHTATLLTDGRVLIVGGFGGNLSGALPLASIEAIGDGLINVVQLDNMRDARAGHTATRVGNGTVIVAGGTNGHTALDTVEVFVY